MPKAGRSNSTPPRASKDSTLVARCRAFTADLAAYIRDCEADDDPGIVGPERDELLNTLFSARMRHERMAAHIATMPALTTRGRRAKAEALVAFLQAMIPESEMNIDRIIAGSLAADLLRHHTEHAAPKGANR